MTGIRLGLAAVLTGLAGASWATAQDASVVQAGNRWIIQATGRAEAPPEISHLLMKMEYQSARAVDGCAAGERQLKEFLAAVEALQIPHLTWRVVNNVITPAADGISQGFLYVRNIVFDLPHDGRSREELDSIVARLEDLGARHNSHCVTCIGSG